MGGPASEVYWELAPMMIGVDASRAARPQRTGTENYAYFLIRSLLAMGERFRYRLYFDREPSTGRGQLFPSGPWEACVIPLPRLWTHLRLSWEVTRSPPDLLFVPSHVLPVLHPRRSVVTVHDLGFRVFPEAHRPFERWYLEWSTRYHARTAARLLADSEATRADLISAYQVPPNRVTVVYPGRNLQIQRVEDHGAIAAAKSRYAIAGDYILHVGTLRRRKNLSRLAEAFALMNQDAPAGAARPKLVLAGTRSQEYDRLTRRVNGLGLGQDVVFTGYVAQSDLAPLLTGASCLAFPSLYEGFGFPVLEAMACGTPVICSDASSLPEVAGDAALLLDPTDTQAWAEGLRRVMNDVALRHRLVHRGFEQVRAFSWERAARQVLRVFSEVLDA